MRRLLPAYALGIFAGWLSYVLVAYGMPGPYASDFSWPWLGAVYLLAGRDPYTVVPFLIPAVPSAMWNVPLFYPLPAVLLAVPLAWLSAPVAQAVFVGCSVALLAYVLHDRAHLLPLLASAPLWWSVVNGQWSPLILAAALLSSSLGGVLLACKPSLGLALILARLDWPKARVLALTLVASGVALPLWWLGWLANMRLSHHVSLWSLFPLSVLLCVVLVPGWQDWRCRLLALLVFLPHAPGMYELLPLVAVGRTKAQTSLLVVCSWLAFVPWFLRYNGVHFADMGVYPFRDQMMYELLGFFIPAACVLMWQYRASWAARKVVHA